MKRIQLSSRSGEEEARSLIILCPSLAATELPGLPLASGCMSCCVAEMPTVLPTTFPIISTMQATLGPAPWGFDPSLLHLQWPGCHPHPPLRAAGTFFCCPYVTLGCPWARCLGSSLRFCWCQDACRLPLRESQTSQAVL